MILWYPAIKGNNQLAVMTVIWDLGYLFIGLSLGIFVFGEAMTAVQWIGVSLGAVAIFLLI
jgi:drug/metabolite transporter (DMT)-like permease